jgi:hypothetical protein
MSDTISLTLSIPTTKWLLKELRRIEKTAGETTKVDAPPVEGKTKSKQMADYLKRKMDEIEKNTPEAVPLVDVPDTGRFIGTVTNKEWKG